MAHIDLERHRGLGAKLDNLRWLGLRANQLGAEGAALLAESSPPSLEVLHIGDNALGDAAMAALAPLLVRLVELSCGDNRLGADAMATIADAHRLTILDIEDSRVELRRDKLETLLAVADASALTRL